ncbi:hypothetical protein WAK64_21115 [Bacillus spongiae]|uniref:Uncharacterized protein n=1 Tax=Bacillus spongiae TaxID=2683610 RepID=A0ABU8HJU7_9BACI
MISISLFIECKNKNESLEIFEELKMKIEPFITTYELMENDPYPKIDGWFVIRYNLETLNVIDNEKAESILEMMSNKWHWKKGWANAIATERIDGSVFFNEKVKFIVCWFEDFE